MSISPYFFSCDWGTTNFRLRLVESESLKIMDECKSSHGIKRLYDLYANQRFFGQREFFTKFLLEQVYGFPAEYQHSIVVASGMSTSSIGLMELPYVDLPFDISGGGLNRKSLQLRDGSELLLVSGVKSETGMMRGEEVQAIGLGEYLLKYKAGILILTGTHCKHLSYAKGGFYKLKNFMTGELFDVLCKHSILANSILPSVWKEQSEDAFKEGLHYGLKGNLLSSLLTVRVKDVIDKKKKEDNYYFLSGLLLGDELSYLRKTKDLIFLAAPKPMFNLYKTALESFLDAGQLVLFDDDIMERALILGHKKILQLHAN